MTVDFILLILVAIGIVIWFFWFITIVYRYIIRDPLIAKYKKDTKKRRENFAFILFTIAVLLGGFLVTVADGLADRFGGLL